MLQVLSKCSLQTMMEQNIPLQPMGTTWSKSPCPAMEEQTVKQCMKPEGDIAPIELPQEQLWVRATAHGERSTMGQEGFLGPVWSNTRRLGRVVWSYIGAALEEMQMVGSPHVVNLGRMVSNGRDPMWRRDRE